MQKTPQQLKKKQPNFTSSCKSSDHLCSLIVTLLDQDYKVRTVEVLHIRPKQGTKHCISPVIHWSLVCQLLPSISLTFFGQISPYG